MIFSKHIVSGTAKLASALVVVMAAALSTAAAQVTLKVGHDQPEHSTHHRAAVKWKELVEERTNNGVKVEIFHSMLLGSGTQMVEQVQAGALEVAILPTGWAAPLAPAIQVLDLPFLFPSREVLYKVVDGPVGTEIMKPLNAVNIEGVTFWESGFKQFTGNFPINSPADYQGKKIRTMPAPVIQEQFRAFGAAPTAIDFKELYSALQQRVVDGQENPIATISANRFYEVQKHMTLSDHGFLAYVFMINKPLLDQMPAEQSKILIDAAREAGAYQREIIQQEEAKQLEDFRQAGVEITELTDEQRAAFQQASQPVYDWFAGRYGGEAIELVRAAIAEVQ